MAKLIIGFLMVTPITLSSLSQAQKDALHLILHVFPGAVMVWQGKEIPLKIVKKPGCVLC